MIDRKRLASLKFVIVGALIGICFTLGAVKAQQALQVSDVEVNAKQYVGSVVQVTGMISGVRSETRNVAGQPVPYVKLNLYKVDNKGRKASRYIYVALPASSFQTMPIEGQMMAITGPLKWPYEIAAIDP